MTETPVVKRSTSVTNIMSTIVYALPVFVILILTVWMIAAPANFGARMIVLQAIGVIQLVFIGGVRWGVDACQEDGPNVVHLLLYCFIVLIAGLSISLHSNIVPLHDYIGRNGEEITGLEKIKIIWSVQLGLLILAFAPLLVFDRRGALRNGDTHDHPETRYFLGEWGTVVLLLAVLVWVIRYAP